MDFFLATCQGLGLALACGMLAGAIAYVAGRGPQDGVLLVAGAIAGAILFGYSLSDADHPAWPGWPIGLLAAMFSFAVARGVVEGAAARTQGDGDDGSPGVALPVILAALAVGGLSLVIQPISLLALAGLIWLAVARRQRAARKYEGLRTLR